MPFVYEYIGEEVANRVRWETYPEYQNLWKAHPSVRVIDHELDAFVWCIKVRMPEWPNQVLGMYWKGNGYIRVNAIETITVTPETEGKLCDIFWDVIHINFPTLLEVERAPIESALKEALEIFARHRSGIVNVQVSIR
ncbi:hypothetical protein HX890_12585 [Pseudomonas gingeri]|uniref:hypothetical protein n=1 Tax=Pseudomonas gingeri TaxID=117681 RepID=UPI0015A21600|nr:hypothetical protein [Pseudomonas gingeri]NWD74942.1 hypothetical protein [Pseudomonas gingeri]